MWGSSVRLLYTMWGSSVRLIYLIWGSSVRITSILINFFVRWVCKTRILKLVLQLKMSEVKLIWQMALTICQTGFTSDRWTSHHWRQSDVRRTSSLSRLPICITLIAPIVTRSNSKIIMLLLEHFKKFPFPIRKREKIKK